MGTSDAKPDTEIAAPPIILCDQISTIIFCVFMFLSNPTSLIDALKCQEPGCQVIRVFH